MATPFVPIAQSCSGSTKTRTQRSSSLGSISSSNSSKGPLEDCNMDIHKKTSMPDQMSCGSSLCNSPLIRTKYPGGESTVEYHRSSKENLQEVPESVFDGRPSTPTILGYEVMEERAKFTVYKILIRRSPDESWVVFRRYTDFSRLNDKLKEMFPGFRLALPPKRWFKDNYEHDFLEDRQFGLQAFLQNLVAHKDITNCLAVREFLCLDDPPGPFDSLVESRAFCETLEETNFRLHKDLIEKQKELETLKKMLTEKQLHIDMLESQIRTLPGEQGLARKLSGQESDCSGEVESSVIEADQEGHSKEDCTGQENHTDFWNVPTSENTVPAIDIAEVAEHVE